MNALEFAQQRVETFFVSRQYNCARTMLLSLSEYTDLPLAPQLVDAAVGMHGAGGLGAQCGFVEGCLMFLGVYGRHLGLSLEDIDAACYRFGDEYRRRFGSLECRVLRPLGFAPDNPPGLCDQLAVDSVRFAVEHVERLAETGRNGN